MSSTNSAEMCVYQNDSQVLYFLTQTPVTFSQTLPKLFCIIQIVFFSCQVSFKYKDLFLETLVSSITDKHPEVRQAASYGIGVMGQFGGDVYADACAGMKNIMTMKATYTKARPLFHKLYILLKKKKNRKFFFLLFLRTSFYKINYQHMLKYMYKLKVFCSIFE